MTNAARISVGFQMVHRTVKQETHDAARSTLGDRCKRRFCVCSIVQRVQRGK